MEIPRPQSLEVVQVDFVQVSLGRHGEVGEGHGCGGDNVGYGQAEHDAVGG